MDTNERLKQMLTERGWTEYKLSKMSGLSESTVGNIFRRNTVPSVITLEAICKAFSITLSQFFCESNMVELTPELQELLDSWSILTPEQKNAALQMIKAMHSY